jgi:hypothetical protein
MTSEVVESETTATPEAPVEEARAEPKARRRAQQSIEMQLTAAQRAITVATIDPTIGEAFARFNYTQERIAGEGRQLLSDAMQAVVEQSRANGERIEAQEECERVTLVARAQYQRDVALARAVLRGNRGALEKLALLSARKSHRSGWLLQARRFYSGALENVAIQQLLVEAALTPEKLEGGLGLLGQVEHCLLAQASLRSAAREATQRRAVAMRRLNAWMRDFRGIARIALRDRPQLLEKLGI